jgi:hypothetical protein
VPYCSLQLKVSTDIKKEKNKDCNLDKFIDKVFLV